MTALWQVDLAANQTTAPLPLLSINHALNYWQGNHATEFADGTAPTTPLQGFAWLSPSIALTGPAGGTDSLQVSLDLPVLGLDPTRGNGTDDGATIGFQDRTRFLVSPSNGNFQIFSDTNTVQVTGSGFDDTMTASLTGATNFTIKFKIVDPLTEYSLFLKQWNGSDAASAGCWLSIAVNSIATLTRHVDTAEGEGGDDNLMEISLRNKDYTSINYHDYLIPGLNTVTVTVAPDPGSTASYVLRALAIAES
jgi:hypothetical protein